MKTLLAISCETILYCFNTYSFKCLNNKCQLLVTVYGVCSNLFNATSNEPQPMLKTSRGFEKILNSCYFMATFDLFGLNSNPEVMVVI
jgi:hypothetical protein